MQGNRTVLAGSPWRFAVGRVTAPLATRGVAAPVAVGADNVMNLPPGLYPPENSTAFFLSDTAALAGVNANAQPAGLVLALPVGLLGYIDTIDLLVDGIVATTNIRYTLIVNGSPFPGFNALTIMPRSGAQSVSRGLGPFLRIALPEAAVIGMRFQDIDGGAVTMGAQLRGWMFPVQR